MLEKLNKNIYSIDKALALADEELLKSENLHKVEAEVEKEIMELSSDMEEREQLLIEKTLPKWRNLPKSGVFVTKEEAYKKLEPIRNLLQELARVYSQDKIVKKLKDDDLWVESRTQGKQSHILIGDRKDKKKKAHLIFDETGEMRIDKKDTPPGELLDRIESTLITKDGKRIKSVFEFESDIKEGGGFSTADIEVFCAIVGCNDDQKTALMALVQNGKNRNEKD